MGNGYWKRTCFLLSPAWLNTLPEVQGLLTIQPVTALCHAGVTIVHAPRQHLDYRIAKPIAESYNI
jgi:hypothetical protein